MLLDTADYVFLIALFVILSPGLILTIPGLSQSNIENKGVAYLDGSNNVVFCDSTSTAESECKKPTNVIASTYTSGLAIFIHALVFAALVYLLPQFLGLRPYNAITVIGLALLFALLSPGLILTLPPLSPDGCGEGNYNIADEDPDNPGNNLYCAGTNGFNPNSTVYTSALYPNCFKCQSWWVSGSTGFVPIIVHAVVFAVLTWLLAKYYF